MKCNKRLLVCLIFQTLLIISEGGRHSKPKNSKSPNPGLGLGSRGTSPGRSNSGRVSPVQTNFGGYSGWGPSHSNRVPVQPVPVRVRPGVNLQFPATLPSHSPPASSATAWFKFRPPGTSSRPNTPLRPQNPLNPGSSRPQNPLNPGSFRPHNPLNPASSRPQNPLKPGSYRPQSPVHSGSFKPHTPVIPGSFRPQSPGTSFRPQFPGTLSRPQSPVHSGPIRPQSPVHSGPIRPQSPVHSGSIRPQSTIQSWSSVPSIDHAQSPTHNLFPALGAPKLTYAEAEKQSDILKSASSSSLSSGSSGFNSGSSRSSFSSLGSFSSGSSSSLYRPQPIGLNVVKSTAVMKSKASPKSCVDNIATMPKIIAPAEHCFDYFKLAIAWAPGYAYNERKEGRQIRDKINPAWIIHGLWPSMFERFQDPMLGCQRYDISFNQNRFVEHKILSPLENTWYTILAKEWSDNKKFWEHEFKKHGSCATRSSVIGDDVNYFKRTIELFNQLNIGTTLYENGLRVGANVNLKNIIDSIEDRIGATIQYRLATNDYTHEIYLAELYVCYDTTLRVMDCPNAYRSDDDLDLKIKYLDKLPNL